MKKDTQIENMK